MILSSLQRNVDKGHLTSPRHQSAKSSVKTKLIPNGSKVDKVPLPSTYKALPSKSPSHKASKNRTAFLKEKLDFYDKMNSSHIATNIVDRIFEDTASRIENGIEEMKFENNGAGRRLDGRRSVAEMRQKRTEALHQFENSKPLLSQSWHFADKNSPSKRFRIPLNQDNANSNSKNNSTRPKSQSSVLGGRSSTKISTLTPDPPYGAASSCANNRSMNLPKTSTSESPYSSSKPMIHILDHLDGKLVLGSIPSPGKIDLSGISRYSNSGGEKSEGRSEGFSCRGEKSEVKSEDFSRRSHSDLSISSFSSFADSDISLKTPDQTERTIFGASGKFDKASVKSESGGPSQRQDSLLSLKETPNGGLYESRLEKSGQNGRKLMNGFGENSAQGIDLERTQKIVSEANDVANAVLSRDSSAGLVISRDTRLDDTCSSSQNRAANSSFSLTRVSDATMSPLSLSFMKKSIAEKNDVGPKLLNSGQQADWFESTPKSRYIHMGQDNYQSPINGFRTPLDARMVSLLNPTKMELLAKQFYERRLVQRFFKGWLLVRRARNEVLESLEAKRECKRKAKAWVKVSLAFTCD